MIKLSKKIISMIAAAGLCLPLTLTAEEIPAVVKGADCFACHRLDTDTVGPGFRKIAKKYKGAGMAAILTSRVKNGNSGIWGSVEQNAHPYKSQAEIRSMVDWVLALNPEAPVADAGSAADPVEAAAFKVMKRTDCLTCHAVDKKVIGPSFTEISKFYKGQDVTGALVKKIKVGGSGTFGSIVMTPHPDLKDEDIQSVVEWILGLSGAGKKAAAPAAEAAPAEKAAPAKTVAAPTVDLKTAASKIMNGSDCLACHQPAMKVVGPSWQEIAGKYGKNGDTAPLVQKVKNGGSGVWGTMPMTPHASLKDEDIETVVKWILTEN